MLDAFTGGGAGQSGVREGRQFIVDSSVDFTIRKHALRAGLLFEAGQWDSTQQTNANGTYTFSSLADFQAGLARTFTRRVGDPLVSYSQYQAGWYVQDDFRLTKNLQVSLGLRQEVQTNLDDKWNLAPRAAFTWTVAKTNVRGGYGIFYDWFESDTYEQTAARRRRAADRRGHPQPDVSRSRATSAGTRLPASRIQVADRARSAAPSSRPRSASTRTSTAVDGRARRLHVDARLQRAALDQRERAGERRAARSARSATSPRSARPASARRTA